MKKKKESKNQQITGTLRTNPKGFGFVTQLNVNINDIFISKKNIFNAIDGDTVEIELLPPTKGINKPEGTITKVIKRTNLNLLATVINKYKNEYILHSTKLGDLKKIILKTKTRLILGDRVTVKIINWDLKKGIIEGKLVKKIGNIKDASIDVETAICDFQILDTFPLSLMKKIEKIPQDPSKKDLQERENFSNITCITIDPKTAKDFDDALSLNIDKEGNYHLGVHIADVAHYIQPESQLDKEAYLRCNSSYFPGRCSPMLPEQFSNGLCSLKPNVIRLTVSVMMDFDENGVMYDYKILRSYIKSKKRFTYEEAYEIITDKQTDKYKKLLKDMVKLCNLLKAQRNKRGSIDFALPDYSIEVDRKGNPVQVKKIEYDISHQLVEEYMLKANETIAIHLEKTNSPLIYRTHNKPDQEDIESFCNFATSLGFELPKDPTQKDFQHLFKQIQDSPYKDILVINFIKSMNLAIYSPENVGHYGLALEQYCHFTSPIRRYSDLIAQRLIFDKKYSLDELNEISKSCSEKERISFQAESSVVNLKKLRLLKKYHQSSPKKKYKAIIISVKPYFIILEILELNYPTTMHVSQMRADFFEFILTSNILKGRNTGKILKIGTKLNLSLDNIDLIKQKATWYF